MGAKGQMNSDAFLFQDWVTIEVWLEDQENLRSLKHTYHVSSQEFFCVWECPEESI